ncbi:MAG: hypothetical protein QM811_06525 [Pirellulales bacterium]
MSLNDNVLMPPLNDSTFKNVISTPANQCGAVRQHSHKSGRSYALPQSTNGSNSQGSISHGPDSHAPPVAIVAISCVVQSVPEHS